MPRPKIHVNGAARQAAYRRRVATKRKRDVTECDDLGRVMERLTFIRDTARDLSTANVANWRGWRGSEVLRSYALQDDLDGVVSKLAALLDGDDRPFEVADFARWRERRGGT